PTINHDLFAEISVFVRTGASVQLDIQTQQLPELHSSYKDRVDFNNKTFSLTLKNIQKTDSGLYTARTSGESENNICHFICCVHKIHLRCYEELIICNHSNPVSWKEDRINITQLCFNKENDSKNIQTGSSLLGPVVGLVAVCILICLSVFLYCKYKKGLEISITVPRKKQSVTHRSRAAQFWINKESQFFVSNRDHYSPTILNRQLNKIACNLLEVLTKC
uniref:Immunoglobulin V-set domain-containing protein n=1 Tax=Cyprinus carpio TaxID=7962 RepID=A0A8C1LF57_CYPCA